MAGMFGGVMFSIEAPRFTPVPVVFLTFWLIMVIVGRIFFTGLGKLRSAGVGAPAPEQVRAAAAVAGIVVAVGMMGFAATGPGTGVASAAPCPGGGPATCGPGPGPELTITPPAQQTTAPGGQQGNQGSGQDNNGIATSPAGSGGNNGDGIQAQTPDFGSPGGQAPNIPGNPTGQGQGLRPGQGQGNQQQSPARTTAPGQPTQTGQATQSGQPTSGQPTVTVTQTQSQCPAPGAPGSGGTPGSGGSGSDGGGSSPDGGDDSGAPSWSYLVAEAAGVMAGRRRNGGGTKPTADQAWQMWDQAKEGNRSPAEAAGLKLNPDGTSADSDYDIITVPKEDGDYQKLILMKNQNAPKQYRFPLNTPEGGRSEKNDDGSISVFDRNGEKVGQFNAPWAYDANGKEVPTWYDIEGDDMVQRIEPGPDNVYPIIADPLWDKIKSAGNSVKNFGAGVGRSVADTVEGVGQMVTNPKETAKGMAPLVGLGGDGAPGVGESWGAVGKAFIAKDDFDRGDTAYGAGKVLGNVLQTVVDPTKGAGKVASTAGKAAKAAKAAEEVAETSASTAAKTAGKAAEKAADGAGDAAQVAGKTATNVAGDAASAGTQAASTAAQSAGKAAEAAGDAAGAAARGTDSVGGGGSKTARALAEAAEEAVPPPGNILEISHPPAKWTPDQINQEIAKLVQLNIDSIINDGLVVTKPVRSGFDKIKQTFLESLGTASTNPVGRFLVPKGWNVDHIIDLQLGGANALENLQLLNASVNQSMGIRIANAIKAAGFAEGDLISEIIWKGGESLVR
ncbi:HNH endonuclease signature motif containing protein [Tsukamurella paurometabola]|uniref:HNH endonuclease signature motif containing protein n=1 Tax=Tsukamurella paurometabola TaxID=2061 RepID=UPI0011C02B76|nr:HNH endonuclease signature motif containing protein [Tsukamurella paurometabola]